MSLLTYEVMETFNAGYILKKACVGTLWAKRK